MILADTVDKEEVMLVFSINWFDTGDFGVLRKPHKQTRHSQSLRGVRHFQRRLLHWHPLQNPPIPLPPPSPTLSRPVSFPSYLACSEVKNRVVDSGVTTYADTAKLSLGTRSQHFWLDVFCSWRDMSPFGDIDEERIRNSYCSSTFPLFGEVTCSMLRECRPSLGSGVALRFEHGKLADFFPAQGHQLRGKLVSPPFLA